MKYTVAVDFDGVLTAYRESFEAPHIIAEVPYLGSLKANEARTRLAAQMVTEYMGVDE